MDGYYSVLEFVGSKRRKGLVPDKYQQSVQPMTDHGRPRYNASVVFLVAAVAGRLELIWGYLPRWRSPSRDRLAPASRRLIDLLGRVGSRGWLLGQL